VEERHLILGANWEEGDRRDLIDTSQEVLRSVADEIRHLQGRGKGS
jgi:hypothetical protein